MSRPQHHTPHRRTRSARAPRARTALAVALALGALAGCTSGIEDDVAAPPPAPIPLPFGADVDLTQVTADPDTVTLRLDAQGALALSGRITLPDLCRRVSIRAEEIRDTAHVTIRAQAYPEGEGSVVPPNCALLSGSVPYRVAVRPRVHTRLAARVVHVLATRNGQVHAEREFVLGPRGTP